MFVLSWIRRLYKVLSADASPSAIAFAAAFGLTAGLVPPYAGAFVLLVLLVLLVRVQITTAIAFWAIGSLLRLPLAPALAGLGESLIEPASLHGFWTWALNLPVVAWLHLEHYVVLGGLVAGAVAGAVLFVPLRWLVISYRRWAHDRLEKNRFFRWLTSFWLTRALRFVFVG